MHMTQPERLIAGMDAGGTSFKCGLAIPGGPILARARIPTTTPLETLTSCADFIKTASAQLDLPLAALGVAAFGPIDVDPASAHYGTILNTPKPNWAQTNLKATFEKALNIPVSVDTDVNGALLAEMHSGAAKNCRSAAYITVGTGIGAAIFANGGLIGKPKHPEFGHIQVKRIEADTFAGACPFHDDCLEGLASAKAFQARFGNPQDLPQAHPGWRMEANYLAQACWTLALTFRLERILLGGGLMLAPWLTDMVREAYFAMANGYLGQNEAEIKAMITRPYHGDDAGLMGGLYLAETLSAS